MILQPPVIQFIHEGARGSTNTISLEAKLAKNKPSMGLLLSLVVLCLFTHCTHVPFRMGKLSVQGTHCHGLNLRMEKKKNTFVCTGFLHDFFFWCFVWFQPSLVLFPLEGLSQPLSLTQTLICVSLVLDKG